MSNTIVTRFPPSPTGLMHIGTARTALFNWLYAKKHGGKMLFRIEDTDRARHSEEAVDAMIKAMEWLELDWDGETVSQYENQKRHVEIAEKLLASGKAYKCYCSPEELEAMRETAKAAGKPTFYDRRWRDRDEAEAPDNIKPVIRIKSPLEGESVVKDEVQGDVRVANDHLDDFVILRSDGTPTYMLAVVVDDYDMGVTHVIRGDDHLNNTFRQNVIYDALEWEKPTYAHLPLILGPDGAKMSKRHGAASVEEYKKMGYLPEAMRNYLLRLGWSHGDEEIIPTDKAIELFDLSGINKAAARFDFDKLEHINKHYINTCDPEHLITLCAPLYKERHDITLSETGKARILNGMEELKSRASTLLNFVDDSAFYAQEEALNYDEKAKGLITHDNKDLFEHLHSGFKNLEPFDGATIQSFVKETAKTLRDGKMGKVGMPLRAALSGTTVSPGIFDAAAILGRETCLERLQQAIDKASA